MLSDSFFRGKLTWLASSQHKSDLGGGNDDPCMRATPVIQRKTRHPAMGCQGFGVPKKGIAKQFRGFQLLNWPGRGLPASHTRLPLANGLRGDSAKATRTPFEGIRPPWRGILCVLWA